MAKRFIDTNFYKSPFVRGLKGSLKGLYSFIICDCDGAGIWSCDLQIAGMYIGHEIKQSEFDENFVSKGKAIDLKNGKFFFPDFLDHQYPKGLSIHNPAQKNFIIELQKNALIDSDLKPLWRVCQDSKVMVMETGIGNGNGKGDGKPEKTELKIKVRDNVFLHRTEIEKLQTQFSEEDINWMYDKLSAYKLSKGKKYKSDYGTILNWVVDRLKEDKAKIGKKENGNTESKYQRTVNAATDLANKRGLTQTDGN